MPTDTERRGPSLRARCPAGALSLPALLLASCLDASFSVRPSAEPVTGPHRISVMGVFKGGRMRSQYWDDASPEISAALRSKDCEVGFSDRLRDTDPKLFAKIDEDMKEGGITKEVIDQIAPRAQGDLVLAIEMRGKPPSERAQRPSRQDTTVAPPPARGRGMRGMGGMQGGQTARGEGTEDGPFEVEVSLFSVAAHDVVTTVEMHYTGTTLEDAMRKLGDKLRAVAPEMTCTGWKWPPPTPPAQAAPAPAG